MSDISIVGVPGLPEITPGANLAELIVAAAPDLKDGDILVVTSKIVSKAEGRVVTADRDDAIAAETVRVVARRGPTTIAQTRHGLVMAAAGVDRSNTAAGTVVLLPEDPDGSARRLRKSIADLTGANLGVLITDTMGRPWRNGQTDAAIGAAGVLPLRDHRGLPDSFGNVLEVTVSAVADEIAAAGDLVKGKTDQVPVAIVRGLAELVIAASPGSSPAAASSAQAGGDGPGAAALVRPAAEDMFRLGSGRRADGTTDRARLHRRARRPGRRPARDRRGNDGTGAASQPALAVRGRRVRVGQDQAARRHAGCLGD